MKFTEEMIAEDEKRWRSRDLITELGYCGNGMRDRNDMTNLDIRFYACIMRKAHEILKAQEARVMRWEEVKRPEGIKAPAVWLEDRDKIHVIPGLGVGYGCLDDEEKHFRVRGKVVVVSRSDYGKRWRCWTARPTPEQMRETKWEDTDNG